jgi:hypothetical protein
MKRILPLIICLILISVKAESTIFTSQASGPWGNPATWSTDGSDPDGIPDNNDNVTILNGHAVVDNLANCYSRSITINAGGSLNLNNQTQRLWGHFINNGSLIGNGAMVFNGNGYNISSATTITNGGNWFFPTGSNYTILAGTVISKINYFIFSTGASVTNLGQVFLISGSLSLVGTSSWTNGPNSSLAIAQNISGTGTFNCSAVPNSVNYTSNLSTTIYNTTYYNLAIGTSSAVTKNLTGNLVVLNNLNINNTVTLNCNNFDITIGGNWNNNANTNMQNMATVTFNGNGTINRLTTEQFNDLVINPTGTITLGRSIDCSGSLTVLSGTFDVSASNFAITVGGDFTHNGGIFNGRAGTFTFDGSVAQVCSGSTTTTFNNVTSNNSIGGVSVTGIIIINGTLQVNDRSFGTSGFGSIILTATGATTYAKIGPLGASASLVGTNWTIGAYIDGPATAYWQYLGSPVSGATLADWDNDPRFYMSGVGGNDGNSCCPIFRSVRTYNTAANTYSNVTNTGASLVPGLGFMVWMSDNQSQLTAPLPYDTRGIPNFGTVLRAVTAGGAGNGYNLVSNPYACPIDYSAVVTNSGGGTLHPDFLILLETGNYAVNPNGGIIAPNQGFMSIALVSSNIKFDELVKNTSSNPNILRTANPENYLRITASNSTNGLGGEAVVKIKADAHNGKDLSMDLPYIASPYDDATNIWTVDNDGSDLLMNALDGIQDKLDIPLTVRSGTPGDQLLSFKGLNSFSAYSCAWLEDLATGEKINLKDHDTYSFHADAVGEDHHFTLHFERDGNCPLNEQMLTPSLDASSQVFVNNGNILVKFGFEEKSDVVISVFNVAGQEVSAPKNFTVANETIALESPGAHGIYMVRIAKGDEVVSKKIYY